MLHREYIFKLYLNARHSMNQSNGSCLNVHPHTWEIVVLLTKIHNEYIQFTTIEKKINDYLHKYEGECLNSIKPFDVLLPTMENVGEVFATDIINLLKKEDWRLHRLEISENPTRTFVLSSRLSHDMDDFNEAHILNNQKNEDIVSFEIAATNESIDKEDIEDFNENQRLAHDQNEVDKSKNDDNNEQIETSSNIKNIFNHLRKSKFSRYLKVLGKKLDNEVDSPKIESSSDKKSNTNKYWFYILSILLIVIVSIVTAFIAQKPGSYPWGTDTWGHLFRGNIVYEEIKNGGFFPLYSNSWYDGVAIFRYWLPLEFYIIGGLQFLTGGNVLDAYRLFLIFICVIGSIAWLFIGISTKRRYI